MTRRQLQILKLDLLLGEIIDELLDIARREGLSSPRARQLAHVIRGLDEAYRWLRVLG